MVLNGLIDLLASELKAMKVRLDPPDYIHNTVVLNTLHQIAEVLCEEEKTTIQDFINRRLKENGPTPLDINL